MVAQKFASEWVPCTLWNHQNVKLRFPELCSIPELHSQLLPEDLQLASCTPSSQLAAMTEQITALLARRHEELHALHVQLAGSVVVTVLLRCWQLMMTCAINVGMAAARGLMTLPSAMEADDASVASGVDLLGGSEDPLPQRSRAASVETITLEDFRRYRTLRGRQTQVVWLTGQVRVIVHLRSTHTETRGGKPSAVTHRSSLTHPSSCGRRRPSLGVKGLKTLPSTPSPLLGAVGKGVQGLVQAR